MTVFVEDVLLIAIMATFLVPHLCTDHDGGCSAQTAKG